MITLDASALLAFMFKEPGYKSVSAIIEESCLSTVNLAEVVGRFSRDGYDSDIVLKYIESTSIEIVPFSKNAASIAADLIPAAKPYGLSLADRSCLALAIEKQLPVITADRIWNKLEIDVDIQIIR